MTGDEPPFRRIAIAGVGLIGGSIALGVRDRWPAAVVVGIDRPAVLAHAIGSGAIDRGLASIAELDDADLVTRKGLRGIKRYADQVALCKDVMIPRDADGRLLAPTRVIRDAHKAGLTITGWTFRRENQFLPLQYRSSDDPNAVGDLNGEIETFLDAGMDNFFTDNPDIGQEART